MTRIPEQGTTVAEAETTLVHLLLAEPGLPSATDAFLVDGRLYNLRIDRIDDDRKIKELIDEYR